ncbi:MAG: DoxX family protein, partial [Thermodesulfobacteriota bacterium]
AIFLLRLATGVNFLMHGAVRVFGDYVGFADGMADNFSETSLPAFSVRLLGYAIPLIELLVGIILITGFQLKFGLVIGFLLMTTLIFGMSLLQEWGVVGSQMIYVIALFLIMYFQEEKN